MDVMSIISAVFGNFREKVPFGKGMSKFRPRTHCAWCSRRLVEIPKDTPEDERWNASQFCSKKCDDAAQDAREPSQGELTRQRNRQLARIRAKREIAESMGVGPKAMNPRKNRRRAMFSMAARMYRQR